jgi:DNA repair exonuclease SbcCD ATPase subunit
LAEALGETQKEIIKTKAAIEALKAEVAGLKARKSEAEDKLADLETVYGSLDGNQRRRIPPEKLEQMLELKRLIDGFQKRLDEIQKTPDGRLAKTEAELKRLRAVIDCLLSKLKPNLQDPEKLEDTIARLKAKNEQFAKFVEALVKADNASGFNSLTSYIKAEIILAALKGAEQKDTNFYWLQLKVLKAGGNNRIKTNLVVDIFTGGNRLSHSGGVVVEYILFDRNGLAKASAIFTEYSGYIKSGDIKKQKKTVKVEQTAGK